MCSDVDEGGGGGEFERVGAVVGVIFDATRQYSSKLSARRGGGVMNMRTGSTG